MILWTHDTAAAATGGNANTAWQAARVEIDSRKIQPGDLFVAIKGERFDGHDFVKEALNAGAVAAIVSHAPKNVSENMPLLVVPDVMKALEDLAKAARANSKAKFIGVTGSVGKTSAKEMLRTALSASGKTYATTGNYNNHIGTPLNLANLPHDAAFAVMEMGMNHSGEIAHLTRMVEPNIAIITTVEEVHLEFFDSLEHIAEAKAEIFEGVVEGGAAILNADSKHVNQLKMAAAKNGISHVMTFGESSDADARLIAYQPLPSGCDVDASVQGEFLSYHIGAIGKHWAKTSLAVLAVARALKLDLVKTAGALSAFSEVEGRGKCSTIPAIDGEATLINDSYNASPASMRSAFAKTLEVWESLGKKGRKLAALGDMLELGAKEQAMHAQLAHDLTPFDKIFTAGDRMKYLHDALAVARRGAHVPQAGALLSILKKELHAGDVLLIKGSHGSKMYTVADALIAEANAAKEKKHAV